MASPLGDNVENIYDFQSGKIRSHGSSFLATRETSHAWLGGRCDRKWRFSKQGTAFEGYFFENVLKLVNIQKHNLYAEGFCFSSNKKIVLRASGRKPPFSPQNAKNAKLFASCNPSLPKNLLGLGC